MENLRTLPFHKRLSLRVFLFNGILLIGVITPTYLIQQQNYKVLGDRNAFSSMLFEDLAGRLGSLPADGWPAAVADMPKLLSRQRVCVLDDQNGLVFDSGIQKEFDRYFVFDLLLPSPYVDGKARAGDIDHAVLIDYLKGIDIAARTRGVWTFNATRSVRYPAGMDRISINARRIRSADGKELVVCLTGSLVDILIHDRSIKERFLILYALVILLSVILTFILSRSVTRPLWRLYRYSREILASPMRDAPRDKLPRSGEIGDICRALQSLIREQKSRSENFMRFSSDVVHELKTPLAAIRSGLEVYAESTDEREKGGLYARMNGIIQQMENLMDEIQFLGSMESGAAREECADVMKVIEEASFELNDAGIAFDVSPGVEKARLPVSADKAYHVLMNLLRNAVSFSPQKGSVTASLFCERGFLAIRVRDRGPGIPEEVFSRITDRFFSFRPRDGGKHSGLGLSIVDAILRGCGGRLEYRNRTRGGAEFICRIPLLA